MMRDEPLTAPIPEAFQPDSYYRDRGDKASAELARLESMKPSELLLMAAKMIAETIARLEESQRETATELEKCQRMKEAVARWQPPTPDHQGLKAFMLEQLNTSTQYAGIYAAEELTRLRAIDPMEYARQHIESVRRDVHSCAEQWQQELERTRKRNKWLAALRQSLQAKE